MSSPPYCYPYPRPAVTTDVVVFAWLDHALQTLLIRRGKPPFEGRWAIPGGFLDMEEDAEAGARRELEEETGLVVPGAVEPLGFFARPGRDPRGRTITLAHVAVLPAGEHAIQAGDDAAEAAWHPVEAGLDLAFDHAEILGVARSWLREEVVDRSPMTQAMLPRPLDPADVRRLFRVLAISTRGAAGWIAAARR